jgi:glucose-6-phosphate-specific signal transduction histidine kinase
VFLPSLSTASRMASSFASLRSSAAIIVASLIEHFLAYFAAMCVLCRAWPRPLVVAGALMVLAAVLEALQTLKPDHELSVLATLSSMAGVATAVPLAVFLIRPAEIKVSSKLTNAQCDPRSTC